MRPNSALLVLALVVPLLVTGAVTAQTGGGVSGLIELLESVIGVLESLLEFLRGLGSGM
jgi:hypothetical protein